MYFNNFLPFVVLLKSSGQGIYTPRNLINQSGVLIWCKEQCDLRNIRSRKGRETSYLIYFEMNKTTCPYEYHSCLSLRALTQDSFHGFRRVVHMKPKTVS